MRSQQLSDPHERQFGDQVQTADTVFPAETRGFLYYYSPPNQNPIGGGLRFRVAETPGKDAFLAGHDLMMPHGLPWHLPVWEIVVRGMYRGLLGVLEQDGFAPRPLQAACRALNVSRDSVFITALGQPWAVNWASEWSRIYIARPNGNPVAAIVRHPWYCMGSARAAPYTGRGLVSLIRIPSSLPPPDARSFDPSLALRIDAVHHLQIHAVNHRTLTPAPGATALFRPRLIHKSTKVDAEVMDAQVHAVLRPANELPWARPPKAGKEGEELFEVYRHREPQPQVDSVPEPRKAKSKSVVAGHGGYVSFPCLFAFVGS
ncbi:hypothetical protein B0H14DRAFT_2755317 [Mycena olivaceomarginata]|nr:hypothetical protein B0H14DRAFT_2755317 [Mycena olivaceomarginata]